MSLFREQMVMCKSAGAFMESTLEGLVMQYGEDRYLFEG